MERHWHSELDKSARSFAEGATIAPIMEGHLTVIEVEAFSGGVIRVVSSRIAPNKGVREIWQETALMFHDIDEAKDAVDLILDRLSEEAAKP